MRKTIALAALAGLLLATPAAAQTKPKPPKQLDATAKKVAAVLGKPPHSDSGALGDGRRYTCVYWTPKGQIGRLLSPDPNLVPDWLLSHCWVQKKPPATPNPTKQNSN